MCSNQLRVHTHSVSELLNEKQSFNSFEFDWNFQFFQKRTRAMGVPAFFRWLSRKYPSVIVECVENKVRTQHLSSSMEKYVNITSLRSDVSVYWFWCRSAFFFFFRVSIAIWQSKIENALDAMVTENWSKQFCLRFSFRLKVPMANGIQKMPPCPIPIALNSTICTWTWMVLSIRALTRKTNQPQRTRMRWWLRFSSASIACSILCGRAKCCTWPSTVWRHVRKWINNGKYLRICYPGHFAHVGISSHFQFASFPCIERNHRKAIGSRSHQREIAVGRCSCAAREAERRAFRFELHHTGHTIHGAAESLSALLRTRKIEQQSGMEGIEGVFIGCQCARRRRTQNHGLHSTTTRSTRSRSEYTARALWSWRWFDNVGTGDAWTEFHDYSRGIPAKQAEAVRNLRGNGSWNEQLRRNYGRIIVGTGTGWLWSQIHFCATLRAEGVSSLTNRTIWKLFY